MNHQGRLRAWARAGTALAVAVAGSAALNPAPAHAAVGPVVVSLTFDDGLLNQYQLAPLLAAQGVPATFYVNSGEVNTSGNMSWDQTRELAAAGHEIGGHTISHVRIGGNLATISDEEKVREVCDDRAKLVAEGLNPVAFAYPFGAQDARAQEIVRTCGYQSARRAGGIAPAGPNYADRLPEPIEGRYSIRVLPFADGVMTAAAMQTAVENAYANDGGWVPMLFHRVCHPAAVDYATCRTTAGNVDVVELDAFLTWAKTHSGVSFKTVTGALGGGTPPPPPPPPADTTAPIVTIGAPANGSTVTTGTPTISGTGGAAATDDKSVSVSLYSGSSATGATVRQLTAAIGAGGAWSTTPATALPNGTYTVRATQKDAADNTGTSNTVTFTVKVGSTPPPPPPPPPADTTAPVVSISSPSTGATVDTSRPTIAGKGGIAYGDQGTVSVSVYSGSSATGTAAQTATATLAKDGAWSVTTSTLAEGTYTVRATQKDAAGNTGTSNTVTFTVKTPAPKPPTSKPTITTLSRATLGRGATNATVVVTGEFRPDSVVTFSGKRVWTRVLSRSTTTVELAVTVARNAGMQPRDVTVKNADGGSFTCDKCFRVVKGPRIKALLQDRLERGSTTWVAVRGSGFGKTTEVAVSGKGVSVRKVVVVGPRRIKVVVYVAPGAKRVARSVTVTDTVTLGSDTMPRSLRLF
jgi:peptidoglycan/xylan/chitin deacetylase (PgdA/CDA1 family)